MASSNTAIFEKILQATDLESVGLTLLSLTYNRFTHAADRERVELSKAKKKSDAPQLVTKTWIFDDATCRLPPALRDGRSSNWEQRRNPFVNYEDDSFCKLKMDKNGMLIVECPQWPPYFLATIRKLDVQNCLLPASPHIFGRRVFGGPGAQDEEMCHCFFSVTFTVTSLPFMTSAEVTEFLEFTMTRMMTAKTLPGTKSVTCLEQDLAKKSEELAKESQERQKCSAELQQLSSTVIKCAARLRKAAVVGADRLPKDHRKNAAAAIEGAVTTACEVLGKQKEIADEALRAKLLSLELSNKQLTVDLGRAGALLDDTQAQVNQLDNEVTRLKEELVEQMECQYCRVNKVDTAFACGHVCCNDCAERQRNALNEQGQTYRGCPNWCVGTRSGKPVRHTFKLYF